MFAEFNFEIDFITTEKNKVADFLTGITPPQERIRDSDEVNLFDEYKNHVLESFDLELELRNI